MSREIVSRANGRFEMEIYGQRKDRAENIHKHNIRAAGMSPIKLLYRGGVVPLFNSLYHWKD